MDQPLPMDPTVFSDDDDDYDQRTAAKFQRQQQIYRYIAILLSMLVAATASLLESVYTRQPYHTSILTGQGWVLELLAGHPDRIHCSLGVHHHVFIALLEELREQGYTNSKHVTLEEQLAIFLHACVTGLPIRHLGERFQRSNETISR